jgi:integrase
MATIENRSRYTVSVKNRIELYREFPFTQLKQAKQYVAELGKQGCAPTLSQKENAFLINIVQAGYKSVRVTLRSLQDAEDAIARIEAERRTGLFIDYTKAHQASFEDLLRRYMKEEGPKNKGWEKSEKYKCLGWLEDLDGVLAKRIARKEARTAEVGTAPPKRHSMREPVTAIHWMRKPFANIQTTDIEDYMKERGQYVAPATVDRELDVIRAIFTVATKVWKYRLGENPMDGVRRPKYWNERDRRMRGDEEHRLITSAIEEDRLRSIELRVQELMTSSRAVAAGLPTVYARKLYIKDALEQASVQARSDFEHVPLFETFIQFQIMTAARRGESLGLEWQDIDFEYRSAYLAETKNGRPRKLPLREILMQKLESLPRSGSNVFEMTEDLLRNAWSRIVARAGIEDLHVHDLRHEAISRVAETSKFSLIDLQAFSGHKDVRMLLRYAHLCTTQLASKLDEAFAESGEGSLTHHVRGRKRIRAGLGLSIAAIAADTPVRPVQASTASSKTTAQVISLFGAR